MGEAENLRRRRLFFLRRKKRDERAQSMTIMEHLGELRTRLIISAVAFVVVSAVAFAFYDPIFEFLRRPLCDLPPDKLGPQGCDLIAIKPLEAFQVRIKISVLAGIVLASPIWLYQLWAFIVPGLNEKERKYAVPFVASSLLLFGTGATFAYLTLARGLGFLIGLGGEGLVPFFQADTYINFVGLMVIAFGLTFELPLILLFLGLAGVVSVGWLRRHRRTAIVLIALLAAVVTPSQDPYTFLAMAIPLYGLYELATGIIGIVERRRARKAAKAGS
jgi:sec-independent protein translocase protein TatC